MVRTYFGVAAGALLVGVFALSVIGSISSAPWAANARAATASYENWLASRDPQWIETLGELRDAGDIAAIRGHAEQGDAEAQTVLGEMLCDAERYDEAALWFRRAAERGHAPAMYQAILLSAPAIGREADPQFGHHGENWLSGARGAGHYREVAALLDQSCVPERNREITEMYLEALFFTEFPGSYMVLASAYEYGSGVERNLIEAAALARVALQRSGRGYGAGPDYYRAELAEIEQALSPEERDAAAARAFGVVPDASLVAM